MRTSHDSGVDRLLELDRRYIRGNLAIAVIVALIAPIYVSQFGWIMVFWSCVPVISALVGFASLRERLGLERWYVLHLALVSASIVGPTLATGGIDSPVFQFIPIAGLLWITYFPENQASLVVAPAMTAFVIGLCWRDGSIHSEVGVPEIVGPLIISIVVPLLAVRLVESELTHRRRAVIDQLTGCLNRHALAARSTELQAQMEITNETVGIVVFDVDHFKRVNDTYGHAIGDRVLTDLTYAIRKQLRRFELFYRVGGEEFVVLIAGGSSEDSREVAEHVRATAGDVVLGQASITVSCGVAVASQDLGIAEAIHLADAAMYQAKQEGRNRVVLAPQPAGA